MSAPEVDIPPVLPQSHRSYLLTEAWRHFEEIEGAPIRDPAVEAAAIVAGPTLPARITARARAFAERHALAAAIVATGRRLGLAVYGLLLLGLLLGAAAARVLPEEYPARANAIALLGILLLPNLLCLCLWTLAFGAGSVRGRRPAPGWLGRRTVAIFARLSRQFAHRTSDRAAAAAWLEYLAQTPSGCCRVSFITHGFWITTISGALIGCWWLLSIRQVDFFWGSTLLDETQVHAVLSFVMRPVAAFGFPVPEIADIAASRSGAIAQAPDVRARWGWFILGALVALGLVPRLAAAALCMIGVVICDRRLALDLNRLGYARLQPILLAASAATLVRDPDTAAAAHAASPANRDAIWGRAIPAEAAWLALERAVPAGGDAALDLGVVSTRKDHVRVLAALAEPAPTWRAVVVHADLATTPDRGLLRFVAELVARATRPVYLLIDDTQAAGAWPDAERAARLADWQRLARDAGLAPARWLLMTRDEEVPGGA